MGRIENVELTVLCLIRNGDEYLLQDRIADDWKGFTLPGGHIEIGESIVDAVVREMKEETGLTVMNPKLYGELLSSEEGEMHWVKKADLGKVNLVNDFQDLLKVMLEDELSEFRYIKENEEWKVIVK